MSVRNTKICSNKGNILSSCFLFIAYGNDQIKKQPKERGPYFAAYMKFENINKCSKCELDSFHNS